MMPSQVYNHTASFRCCCGTTVAGARSQPWPSLQRAASWQVGGSSVGMAREAFMVEPSMEWSRRAILPCMLPMYVLPPSAFACATLRPAPCCGVLHAWLEFDSAFTSCNASSTSCNASSKTCACRHSGGQRGAVCSRPPPPHHHTLQPGGMKRRLCQQCSTCRWKLFPNGVFKKPADARSTEAVAAVVFSRHADMYTLLLMLFCTMFP